MLNEFLHYGYLPNSVENRIPAPIIESVTSKPDKYTSNSRIDATITSFSKSVDSELQNDYNCEHIIPLSSGLDSRALLVTLLKRDDIKKSQIQTVTFGTPGTWDFEIGQQVAKKAGVRNIEINLSDGSFDWSLESLKKYTSEKPNTRVLDGYINSTILEIAHDDAVIWSGFMGDPSAGGHTTLNPQNDWTTATEEFAEKERYTTGLTPVDFDPVSVLPDEPFVPREQLSFEEQLDFALRQQCLICPLVIHSEQYRTPFMQPEWLRFSLNLPVEYRRNRRLFKTAFRTEYPELFSLPTDANNGLSLDANPIREWVRGKRLKLSQKASSWFDLDYLHPRTNYIDFANAFRSSGELRNTMHSLVSQFSERDRANWIDPLAIWEDHQNGIDRTNEIRVIASLELHLNTE